MEAYRHEDSTHKVHDLVQALGADTDISKSEVSRICSGLDADVGAFRDPRCERAAVPYVFLDATELPRPGSIVGWFPRPS